VASLNRRPSTMKSRGSPPMDRGPLLERLSERRDPFVVGEVGCVHFDWEDGAQMAKPLVSDELWQQVEPLIPSVPRRHRFPGRKGSTTARC
jgi:hypothetical protein